MRSGSAAGSAAAPVRMAELGEGGRVGKADTASERRSKRPASLILGAVERLGRDEAKALADELLALWRGDSSVGDRVASRLAGLFREVGLVTREELEEAELKIAQLEHRLRLLENDRPSLSPPIP
jgi:polyhydroxyalkanoate synthesis regulator phasin